LSHTLSYGKCDRVCDIAWPVAPATLEHRKRSDKILTITTGKWMILTLKFTRMKIITITENIRHEETFHLTSPKQEQPILLFSSCSQSKTFLLGGRGGHQHMALKNLVNTKDFKGSRS
jgi:hypothetical protein